MNQFTSPVLNAFLPIIRGSCSYPDSTGMFKETNGERIDKITVTPNMADLPILIGSGGRQAKAYKLLFHEAGVRTRKETEFHLEESYDGKHQPNIRCQDEFSNHQFLERFNGLLAILFETPPPYLHRRRLVGADDKFEITIDIGVNPPERSFNISTALNDVCYPYGKRRGVKIEISRRRYNAGA